MPHASPIAPLPDFAVQGDPARPALVLLHAGGMTREEWMPFLEGWTPHFRLVTLTAFGHGASPTVPTLSLDSMAEDALRLMNHLGIERAHLLGSSMGGATALRIALRAPERVDRLVLYRSGFRVRPSGTEELAVLAAPENWRRWGLDRWMERQHHPQGGPHAWMEVIGRVAELFARPESSLTPADLARLRAPTLIVCGDRDPLVPLEDALELFRTFPEAALWIVPGAGHLLSMETWRRSAFQEEVRRFLLRGPGSA